MNSDSAEDWEEYTGPVVFDDLGVHDVDYRATDSAGNTSDPQTVSFNVIAGECVTGSDEFDEAELDLGRWSFRHPTTPASGADAPASRAATSSSRSARSRSTSPPRPVGLIGQPLPDEDFTLVAEITAPGLDSDVGGDTQSRYARSG